MGIFGAKHGWAQQYAGVRVGFLMAAALGKSVGRVGRIRFTDMQAFSDVPGWNYSFVLLEVSGRID